MGIIEYMHERTGLISSIYISDITGVKHKNIIELIKKHYDIILWSDPKLCKNLEIENIKTYELGSSKSYLLSDKQAIFVILLLQNNEIIIKYKELIATNKFNKQILKLKSRGFVYLLKNENLYKIGRAKNIKHRYNSIITQSGNNNIKLIEISDYIFNFEKLEVALHRIYKSKRRTGEWFEFNDEEIQNASFHIEHNGVTLSDSYDFKNYKIKDDFQFNYYIDYEIRNNILKEIELEETK